MSALRTAPALLKRFVCGFLAASLVASACLAALPQNAFAGVGYASSFATVDTGGGASTYVMYYDSSATTSNLWNNPQLSVIPASSSRILTDEDVSCMGPYLLYLARNEIYARHGYIFKNADLASFFGSRSWYVPRYTGEQFDEGCLSYVEQTNIGLIIKWEREWGSDGNPSKQASSYVLPQSSARLLTNADLKDLDVYTLFLARNEIYARHGYIFARADLASFFSQKTWYVPQKTGATFSESVFSYIEQTNIALIIKWERAKGSNGSPSSVSPVRPVSPYILPTSSDAYLVDSDVMHLDKHTLFLARNEIYARHGYIFVMPELSTYFSQQSWYWPRYTSETFDEGELSDIERANISLIQKWENA